MDWKTGDWCIFELSIGQIKEIRDNGAASFSDGSFETSGMLVDRFRPLTLKGKRLVEYFDYYYGKFKEIDGEAGFNYPDIHRHFAQLCVDAIDAENNDEICKKAPDFLDAAREYKNPIQGVPLFRRKLGRG